MMFLKYLRVMLAYFKPFSNYMTNPTTKALLLCTVSSMAFVVSTKGILHEQHTVSSFSL